MTSEQHHQHDQREEQYVREEAVEEHAGCRVEAGSGRTPAATEALATWPRVTAFVSSYDPLGLHCDKATPRMITLSVGEK